MRTVQRHDLDLEFAARQVEEFNARIFEDDVPRLERAPRRVRVLLTHALGKAAYQCALDPAADQGSTWESVTLAMQAGYALFAAGMRSEGTVECRIHTSRVALRATGPQVWTNEGYWLQALYLAMICREKDRTDFLCSVPVDFLRTSGAGGVSDDYVLPWAAALQGWWRRDQGYHDQLFEAVRLADPQAPGADAEWIGLLSFPPLKMFNALVEGAHADFNDALFEALDLHRVYWTKTAERARDFNGYIALAPLALTCLAKEMGFPIEVRSEYVPQRLVDGAWVGEFSV